MRNPADKRNCPYCLSPIESHDEQIQCPQCGVVHHAECWRENGCCSVYGCDGWAVWNDSITSRIAPKIGTTIEISKAEIAHKLVEEVRCIKCGDVVEPGQLLCWNCKSREKKYYFDNCAGPSILLLGGLAGMITLIIKALV